MTVLGVDFAYGHLTGRVLKGAGFSFVCRYLSRTVAKDLSPAEAVDLHDAGLGIVLVWEDTAKAAAAGKAQGEADAKVALALAHDLGVPASVPIYFAVDFDPLASQMPAIAAYFAGIRSVLPFDRIGVYGGYHVVTSIQGVHAKWGWQTYAWSGGELSPAADLYQYSNGHAVAGVSVDFNRAEKGSYGAWEPATKPRPAGGVARFAGTVDLVKGRWTIRGTHGLPPLPHFGPHGGGKWEIEHLPAEGDFWCAKIKVRRT